MLAIFDAVMRRTADKSCNLTACYVMIYSANAFPLPTLCINYIAKSKRGKSQRPNSPAFSPPSFPSFYTAACLSETCDCRRIWAHFTWPFKPHWDIKRSKPFSHSSSYMVLLTFKSYKVNTHWSCDSNVICPVISPSSFFHHLLSSRLSLLQFIFQPSSFIYSIHFIYIVRLSTASQSC